MAALRLFARLLDLHTDNGNTDALQLACSDQLIPDGCSIDRVLDQAGGVAIKIMASEAGGADAPTTAPTAALTSGGALSAGAYKWWVSFKVWNYETILSPMAGPLTATAGQAGNLSAIPVGGAGSGVTARNIYRTLADGNQPYLVGTISDNTTTAYTDTASDGTISGHATPPAPISFARALLNGGSSPTGGATPVPTLLEVSVNGGATVIARKRVQSPVVTSSAGGPTITESGNDLWDVYAGVLQSHPTYTSCYLADVLYKTSGNITPIRPAPVTATAVTETSSLNAGAHKWLQTFVTNGLETIASDPDDSGTTNLTTTAGQAGRLVLALGGGGTTARRIYRNSVALPKTFRLVKSLVDNTTTSYDDTAADAAIASNPQPPGGLGYISATGALAFTQGVMNQQPGALSWPAGARRRLTFTPVLDPVIAFAQTSVEILSDLTARAITTISHMLGGLFVGAGDSAPQGTRGHFVACSADGPLCPSAVFPGVVCDGSPTPANPAGAHGYSNALTPPGVDRTLLIGSVGSEPGNPHLTFDGNSSDPITDETQVARIILDKSSITPDLTQMNGAAEFQGSASNANFPANAKLTSITLLNVTHMSSSGAYTEDIPIIGLNVNDQSGGLYYYIGDGQVRPYSQTPGVAVYDISVDTQNNRIYIATSQGVLYRNTDISDTTTPWVRAGSGNGLQAKVTRLSGLIISGAFSLYALATGNGKGRDGVYLFPAQSGSPTGAGYDGWTFLMPSPTVIDMVATDDNSFFFLHSANPNLLLYYDNSLGTTISYALPTNVKGFRLDRVIIGTSQDSVWICTTGDDIGLYYLLASSGSWVGQTIQSGNADYSILGSLGKSVTVNRVLGPNVALTGTGGGTVYTVAVATNNGLYAVTTSIPTSGGMTGWRDMNGQNGLDGTNCTGCAFGAPQQFRGFLGSYATLPGDGTNRLFVISGGDGQSGGQFLFSNTGGQYWTDLTKGNVDKAAVYSAICQDASGALPSNYLMTIGPMPSSPIGGPSSTHLQSVILPAGWYLLRYLNERLEWCYRTVNGNCAQPDVMTYAISSIQTNTSIDLLTASALVFQTELRWLAENSTPQTILDLVSFFETAEAALLALWPTQTCLVNITGYIKQRAPNGQVIATQWVDMENTPWYCIEHHIYPQANGIYETETKLGSTLRGPNALTPDEIAQSALADLHSVKVFGSR